MGWTMPHPCTAASGAQSRQRKGGCLWCVISRVELHTQLTDLVNVPSDLTCQSVRQSITPLHQKERGKSSAFSSPIPPFQTKGVENTRAASTHHSCPWNHQTSFLMSSTSSCECPTFCSETWYSRQMLWNRGHERGKERSNNLQKPEQMIKACGVFFEIQQAKLD